MTRAELRERVKFALAFTRATAAALLRHIWAFVRGIYRFFGPVADSVKGRVNPDEMARVIVTSATVAGAAGSFAKATLVERIIHHPDFLMVFIIPIVAGVMAGIIDFWHRQQHGGPVDGDVPQPPVGLVSGDLGPGVPDPVCCTVAGTADRGLGDPHAVPQPPEATTTATTTPSGPPV